MISLLVGFGIVFWFSLFLLRVGTFVGHLLSTSKENPRLWPVGRGAYGSFDAPQTYVSDFLMGRLQRF